MRRCGVMFVVLGGLFMLGAAPASATPGGSSTAGKAGGTATRSVSIVDFSFSPKNFTVAAGDTVTWTNNGTVQHTVTADNGSFDSGPLNPGQTFSHTFATGGNVPYHCEFHGGPGGVGMSGVISVSGGTTTTAALATTVPPPSPSTSPASPGPGSSSPASTDAASIAPDTAGGGTTTTVAQLARTGAAHAGWLGVLGFALVVLGAGAGFATRRRPD